ncbi:MAG: nitroreductase family protein [Streptosporangiaceae bacterium]
MSLDTAQRGHRVSAQDLQSVIEAAVWAPSIHNTQPWWFGTRDTGSGPVISLHADTERRLNVADPDGREMMISCGAALATLSLAIRHRGYEPEVRPQSDPDRPALLADVGFGRSARPTEEVEQAYEQIRLRRTHRGAFKDAPVGAQVLAALSVAAERETVRLSVALSHERVALGALTEAAEQVQLLDPAHLAEAARRYSVRLRALEQSDPYSSARDFVRGQGWGNAKSGTHGVTGVVVVLATPGDGRHDWLAAGQALQRVLLRASAAGLSAAFHTQALEVPELREFIHTRLCRGGHPQMLMRLGVADNDLTSTRRSVDQVRNEELS